MLKARKILMSIMWGQWVKKIGLTGCLWLVAIFAFADDVDSHHHHHHAVDFFTFIKNILVLDLQPILGIVIISAYVMGFIMLLGGITRLYRHGAGMQHMMHRVSPMSTSMFFVSGITLIGLMPQLQMLSNSIYPLNPENVLLYQCTGNIPTPLGSSFYTSSNNFCPMQAYSNEVSSKGKSGEDAVGESIKYLMFGVLFLVGLISFVRGMAQLTKIGDGGGQGKTVGHAMTHIFAGIVAINAEYFYELMCNILQSNVN